MLFTACSCVQCPTSAVLLMAYTAEFETTVGRLKDFPDRYVINELTVLAEECTGQASRITDVLSQRIRDVMRTYMHLCMCKATHAYKQSLLQIPVTNVHSCALSGPLAAATKFRFST
jgi:hypothetical protein